MTGTNFSDRRSVPKRPRSLPVSEWPHGDRRAWEEACRPGSRFKPGGAASHLAQVSRDDFTRRYGAFLGFLQQTNRLEQHTGAAAQVTVANVEAYIVDLKPRVRSVTVYNCIHQTRRAAELLAPITDFSWLAEIEKDIALEMAQIEIRPPSTYRAARGGRPNFAGRSAGIRYYRSRPRPGLA